MKPFTIWIQPCHKIEGRAILTNEGEYVGLIFHGFYSHDNGIVAHKLIFSNKLSNIANKTPFWPIEAKE